MARNTPVVRISVGKYQFVLLPGNKLVNLDKYPSVGNPMFVGRDDPEWEKALTALVRHCARLEKKK